MPHYRKLFDERFVGSWDLPTDKPVTVKIAKVGQDTVFDPKENTKETVPVLFFVGKKKSMVLNKTNAKTIARLHGDDTDGWVGKQIALTVENVKAFGEVWPAIRVANTRLQDAVKPPPEPKPDPEPLEDENQDNNPPPLSDRNIMIGTVEKHLAKIGAIRSKQYLDQWGLEKSNWRQVGDPILAEMAAEAMT